ncbi:MAG: peptidylprolyl isomerase [Saprospiraceae bacterium]|nr:peptidylprolyl isomerase [Saprospiraceae bacterium]
MKHLLLTIAFAIVAFASQAQELIIDKVIATVGDELVLLSEVEGQYAFDLERAGSFADPQAKKCEILEKIMLSKLLINQAKLDSVIVSDEEIESQLEQRIDYILGLMNNDINQFEEYYGKGVGAVRSEMRESLREQMTAERMQNKVLGSTTITPSEVKAYFELIPTDSLPYFSSEVEIGEIVLRPEVSAVERQNAIDKLTSLKERIEAGEVSFAEMATTHSDDLGSGQRGGDLGLQRRGTFVPEFEAAAYNLDEGELSEIVESDFGFHLIELLERRGNMVHVRHILIRPEITQADLDLTKAKLDSIRSVIIKDTLDFTMAVKQFSDEDEQSYNNGGRMINPNSGDTFFATAEIDPPDIFFALDTMDIGELSAPFIFTDPAGEQGFRIVQLQSRTDPHRANLQQDYTKIKQAAIEQQKSSYMNEWLEDKIKTTFVRIDGDWRSNCPILDRWGAVQGLGSR